MNDVSIELDIGRHFKGLGYDPHKGQAKIHRSEARHRVAACGRRFGKSVIGGHETSFQPVLTEAVMHNFDGANRDEIWLVGPEYSDAEKEFRVVWNDIKRMELPLDRPGSYYNAETGDMVASLFKGKLLIHGKSSKYPDTLVGEGLTGVVMCEAAKMKATIWGKYIRPALADKARFGQGWSLWLSTPEGKNHFYEAYQRGLDPDFPTWSSWRMPSYENPYVFPLGANDPEVAEMRAEMSDQRAEQEIEASFTDYVGAVFKDFDEEIHVRDLQYRRDLPIYGCCDFGWTNPFVWLAIQIDVWDNVYVLGEYRCTHKDVPEIAEEIYEWPLARHAVTLYPDPAEPDSAHILSKTLKCNVNPDTGGELKWRLHYIRRSLKRVPEHLEDDHPEKQPKLFIDRRCKGLIREMQDYRYPDNKSEIRPDPEEPMDKDNHGPEALGRFFRGYFGAPSLDGKGGRSEVSRANIGGVKSRPVRRRRRR
jgi:hypothetical protein